LGNLQGAAFLPAALNGQDGKDRIYIFKQRPQSLNGDAVTTPYGNSTCFYEPATGNWTVEADLNGFQWAPMTHMGSACFGPSVLSSYVGTDGNTYHCTIPFVYVTGHAKVNASGQLDYSYNATTGKLEEGSGAKKITCVVLDLENRRIVRVFAFPDRSDDCIMTYDWTGNRLWVIGYTQNVTSGKAPYVIDEYRNVDMTDFCSGAPTRWDYSTITPQEVVIDEATGGTSSTIIVPTSGPFCLRAQDGGPDADGIQRTLECGTVQDCFYHNDHIYIVTGRGSLYNRTECVKIHGYCVQTNRHRIEKTVVTPLHGESQGLVFDGTNIWVTLSGSNLGESGLYKVSPRAEGDLTYDALNYKEANEITPATTPVTYAITCGEELVWWLQQVYAGRTDIQAVLQNDIDMTGIQLPTSYYIYEKPDANGNRTFEAQYAFRGLFDGQGHTISNLSIPKTPFYNDGLIPYAIGATIQDVTIEGTIKLTGCTTAAGENKPVANVGFIGTMEGGTVSGVDVTGLTIDYNGQTPVDGTINKLIGNAIGVNIINCTTETAEHPTHATHGGHYYVNGICQCSDACDPISEKYQAPGFGADGTTYMITNAGNLLWWANHVKTNPTSCAKLAADINLDCGETFLGIGSSSKPFAGTFDGQGYTISGYSRTCDTQTTTGLGFFQNTNGATISNFTLEGDLYITGADNKSAFLGGVIGKATNTTIEQLTSTVNIHTDATVNGKADEGIRIVGGIAGWANGCSISRCRYNGTMTLNASTDAIGDRFAGIVGMTQTAATTITDCLYDGQVTAEKTSIKIAGILGKNAVSTTISNCLSVGQLTLQTVNTTTGMIIGQAEASTLTLTNSHYTTSGLTAGGNAVSSGYNTRGTLNDGSDWPALTTTLIGSSESETWKIVEGQPYPIPYTEPIDPEATYYTITFTDFDDSLILSQSIKEGNPVSAPQDPVRTGYSFSGWTPAVSATATANATYKATYTAIDYTLTYLLDGATYATQTYHYGDAITAPQDPEQEGYTFSGWTDLPDAMPANDLTVNGSMIIESDDPRYANGFLIGGAGTEEDYYQEPTLSDGIYLIKNAGQLWWFMKLVNSGSDNRVLNAKLVNNIDMEGSARGSFPGIGIAESTCYSGVFDGNGKTIRNFYQNERFTSARTGFFHSIRGTSSRKAVVKNFTIMGVKHYTSTSTQAMHGTVVGDVKAYALLEDVVSQVNFTTDKAFAIQGGIAGCVLTNGEINRCTYSGTIADGCSDRIGGIVGEMRGGTVSNCLFAGTINNTKSSATVGGIAGATGNNGGNKIKNCLVLGTLNVSATSTSGIIIAKASTAVTLSDLYSTAVEGLNAAGASANVTGSSASVTADQLINGEACALLNANSGQWSQILGYQLGAYKTAGSPAQANPVPGTAYPVSKDDAGHYTIGYFFFDDLGDTTPLPAVEEGTTIVAHRISYTRSADYMTSGFISVCMPFRLTDDLLPGGADCQVKLFDADNTTSETVYFTTVDHDDIRAGVPYFIYLPEDMRNTVWEIDATSEQGFPLVAEPENPASGILGSFNTVTVGEGYYKLNGTGTKLVLTTARSSCFPFRSYLQLPQANPAQAAPRISFRDFQEEQTGTATGLDSGSSADADANANAAAGSAADDASALYAPDAIWYNVLGQQVDHHATGLIICRGQKYFIR